MWNIGLDELKTSWNQTAGRNINNFRCADDTNQMVEIKKDLKTFLMKVKESEKAGLKLNIKRIKIMASDPITS